MFHSPQPVVVSVRHPELQQALVVVRGLVHVLAVDPKAPQPVEILLVAVRETFGKDAHRHGIYGRNLNSETKYRHMMKMERNYGVIQWRQTMASSQTKCQNTEQMEDDAVHIVFQTNG